LRALGGSKRRNDDNQTGHPIENTFHLRNLRRSKTSREWYTG
jgi:hypothetical protein